jgi:imidazolonepropionase-like amidohydrolase
LALFPSILALWISLLAGSAATPAGSAPVAFVHANVVPMDSERVLADRTVVVSGGRIAAIGPSGKTTVPAGAKVVDARGGYLSPGLADMHVHVYWPEELTLYVVNGVTTVFNLNGRPQYLGWRERIADGQLLGPYLYSTGPTFSSPRTPEAAVRDVDEIAAAGYDGIKIYNQVGAKEYPALTAEAKKKGLVLVGHVAREPGFAATLAAGQSIAHAEEYVYTFFREGDPKSNTLVPPFDALRIPRAVAMTREAGISVIPTLVAFRNIVRQAENVRKYLTDPNLVYIAPSMRAKLEPAQNTYANRFDPEVIPGLAVSYEFQRQLVKALHAGGVPILAGTDASWLGVPGFCLIEEIEIYQELGFTPYAALKTATVDPARLLGKEKEFGTIAEGRRADLVLTRGNPLEDVSRLRNPEGVMVAGRWIPEQERRSLLRQVPESYRTTMARLLRDAESNPQALDEYLRANDPRGEIGNGVLSAVLDTRGPAGLTKMLEGLARTNPRSQLVSEETLNEFGYALLGSKRMDAAIAVLQANTELYPKSGNTWDSLAEAYMAKGDRARARQLYARALEVDPDYPNAKAAREIVESRD